MTWLRRSNEAGLTLVELMASILLFSLVTLGVTPLLITSVRGAGTSRSYTVAKNVTQQAIERMRGLPYFISYATQNRKVDLLDLYFPSTATGYSAADHSFTTVCTAASAEDASCPGGIPDGYTVTHKAQFVRPSADTTEEYVPTQPPSGYAWDSVDTPPSRLLRMSVLTTWTFGGQAKNYSITSLLGDRRVAENSVAGNARLEYVVQVLGSYVDGSGVSELKFRAGISDTRIESRLLSEASVTTMAGDATLTRPATGEGGEAQQLGRVVGATSIYRAPENTSDPAPTSSTSSCPEPATSCATQSISHPGLGNVRIAGFSDTFTKAPLHAKVLDENPSAAGSFGWNAAGQTDMWVKPQADLGSNAALRLNSGSLSATQDGTHTSPGVFHMLKRTGSSITGTTEAYTGTLGSADRRVKTSASASFGQVHVFPVDYISSGSTTADKSVIRIHDFTSQVTCDSTAAANASATASYTAVLSYYRNNAWDGSTNPHGTAGSTAGSYVTVPLSGAFTSDPLAAIGPSQDKNPLVYKDPLALTSHGSPFDIYLFPIRHEHTVAGLPVIHNHPGYLDPGVPWESAFNLSASTQRSSDGRHTGARIPGAISLTTVPLKADTPQSGLNITIGNMACNASDLR